MRRSCLALLLAASSSLVLSQAQKPPAYQPHEFQPGKDIVWVPTAQAVVDKMLDMARVTPGDYVMDLGSGDGRMVITAAKRGARALGIEYEPELVELSRRNAEKEGVAGKASFIKADLFETDFSAASVIAMFLPTELILKLRPKILALKPGTRVVSNTFTMGDWQADEKVMLTPATGCDTAWCTALLWIVPASVAGTYKLPEGDLILKQNFQMLSGTLTTEGKTFALGGKVRGEEITFTAGSREYLGRMNGKSLELH
jgi:precorrin-6B methylase 2